MAKERLDSADDDEDEDDYEEDDRPRRRRRSKDDGVSTLIPYKNMPALLSYYFGIFSLIPCFGLLLAIPAIVLGIIGLVKKNNNPEAKGTAHAIVGLVLSLLSMIVQIVVIILFFRSLPR